MIEKMKVVCIVSSLDNKEKMLGDIRNLGLLHIREQKPAELSVSERFSSLSKTMLLLNEYPDASDKNKVLSDKEFLKLNKAVDEAVIEKKKLSDEISKFSLELERVSKWGDFVPQRIKELKDKGFSLFFYTVGKKEYSKLCTDENVNFVKLAAVEKQLAIAVLDNPLDSSYAAIEFEIPEMGCSELEKQIAENRVKIEKCNKTLANASKELASFKDQLVKCKNDLNYSSASLTSVEEDGLVWISGYIPESDVKKFESAAHKAKWAYIIDDVEDDDEFVPTKVRYNKVTTLMEPIFSILGTVPGYHEYDISFWFLCFFSLFFAMIIGDAGYGVIFLALGIGLHVKKKKVNNLILLVYVLSISTIIWGALTGTWLGLEGAMNIGFLKKLVIPAIANYPEKFGITTVAAQNNVMKFCFIIGTVQLTLACIMNIRKKITQKDLSMVADLGWLMSINALYYVVLLLVIGENVNLIPCAVVIISGFLLVCLFGGMSPDKSFSQGLKAGLADSFTNFLNTISAFGNVMSYIRLFAVGMASLAIAQSFNDMASGFTGILKIAGILIMVIGHSLNLVMGLLSVVVHGVRLNLLEFSGQLGMEWSGTSYEPFRVINK